jgi:anti-anti-sigma factor
MQGILDGGELNVVIDLSSVPHVDSTGLGRLLQAICRFERAGGTLKLLRPSNYVRNLLAITKVVAMVPVVESIDEGLPDRAGVACYGPA